MSATAPDKLTDEFVVHNPATGEETGRYPVMGGEAVDKAVSRAREKFPEWAASSFEERREILLEAASILAEKGKHYAAIIAGETGKTRVDALLAEVFTACDVMHYYAKNARKFLRPVHVSGNPLLPGRRGYYTFEPKGVVGVISPWNYPFTLSSGPVVTAISAGNTVLLKPSSQTTASGLILKEILEKAGLPEGVLQVLSGSGSVTGQALIDHPGIDMLFFTGSTEVGRMVNVKAAERLIPAVMELGGKDFAIVTRNADIERAASSIVWGAFTNCGQTCIGIETALVDRAVYKPFLDEVKKLTKKLESGPGEGQIGSMTMKAQVNIVRDQLDEALEKGAKPQATAQKDDKLKGHYLSPTVLEEVDGDMKVMQEETFGPLLPVIPYDDVEEAIEMANSTPYGLAGAVFSRDLDEARSIAKRIKSGSININDVLVTFAYPALPFGGMKQSGVGRYHGKMGIQSFCNVKSITEFRWNMKKEFYHYPMPKGVEDGIDGAIKLRFSRNKTEKLRSLIKIIPFVRSMLKKRKK